MTFKGSGFHEAPPKNEIVGWNYAIVEWCPGFPREDDPPCSEWRTDQHRVIITRDTLEGAQRVFEVLCETDVSHTAYGIILTPVYAMPF